jgi:superfamily II DNA helicase RecQ
MKLKFFTIPIADPDGAEAELNRFLGAHRVSRVEKEFVADGAASAWSVVVTWVDGAEPAIAQPAAGAAARAGRVDYREVLSPPEFAVYDRLRTLRKELAQAEGLPPYAVFSNEQLAAFVQRRISSEQALAAVEGVGEGRLQRYGSAFVALLRQAVPGLPPLAAPPADRPAGAAR